ncbi:ATP-binding protein [Actinoplanes aureus]|uniref:ATP-binding protein n=1 Tax=Actinoplanes aureus TaxID=2792083 RepID=A0A931G030_9ACTN|nr:ATP-binding protein [Actinoplanes aureus]MBG0565425.1 ATP-binding protein [Actinoplanes aureus]
MTSNQVVAAPVRRAHAAVAEAVRLQADAARAVAVARDITTELARYGGPPPPSGDGLTFTPRLFTAANVSETRHLIIEAAGGFGLAGDALSDFVLAVYELLTNAVRHGGGWGRVALRRDGDLLTCVTTDYGPGFTDEPAGDDVPPPVMSFGGRGLFLARQLTDSMQISSSRARTAVTVTVKLPRAV